jgi:hypothetical protein
LKESFPLVIHPGETSPQVQITSSNHPVGDVYSPALPVCCFQQAEERKEPFRLWLVLLSYADDREFFLEEFIFWCNLTMDN